MNILLLLVIYQCTNSGYKTQNNAVWKQFPVCDSNPQLSGYKPNFQTTGPHCQIIFSFSVN